MKKSYAIIIVLLLCFSRSYAQQEILDIPAIHQLIDQSKSEHSLQLKARNQQALASSNEEANLTLLQKFKNMSRTLQKRYNTLGSAINVAEVGASAVPMVKGIVSNQAQIISLAEKTPALIAIGYQSEIQFATKANALVDFVTGLILAFGDVNQMKASDRKILFDYALSELSNIQDLSGSMLSMMQNASVASLLRSANPFQNYVDADRSIGKSILQNAKYLK